MGTSTGKTASEYRARSRARLRRSKASLDQFGEGAGAVRNRVLGRGLHFAEGDVVAVGDEHRVVAKAFRTARRPHQMAENLALKYFGVIVRPGKGERADKMRAIGRAGLGCHLLVEQAHRGAKIFGWAG